MKAACSRPHGGRTAPREGPKDSWYDPISRKDPELQKLGPTAVVLNVNSARSPEAQLLEQEPHKFVLRGPAA